MAKTEQEGLGITVTGECDSIVAPLGIVAPLAIVATPLCSTEMPATRPEHTQEAAAAACATLRY